MYQRGNIWAQQEMADQGKLQISVQDQVDHKPVEQAVVQISYTGETDKVLMEFETDSSGQTPIIELLTPPLEYSMEAVEQQPYSQYTVRVRSGDYESSEIAGVQLLADTIAQQKVFLHPRGMDPEGFDRSVIPPHTLFGEYPPKEPEAEIKPITESGEIVLNKVVIPEYIVVHDGPLGDSAVQNYYVKYRDYIKNVASSEIYATWPDNTIRANVLAIMSFTLNRVYTEWYRNKGYYFTITSMTAYDHKWIPNRNIYDSIDRIVDELFENYLSRPDVRQPILTQYCDGKKTTCRNRGWMTQWGSKELGDQGYSAMDILRYFYGNNLYINVAEEVSGIPMSWPGYELKMGSRGSDVRKIQEQLNTIGETYSALPKLSVDGIYGTATESTVKKFQSIFGLPQTGVIDYRTWYKIQEIYVGVTRIAELS